MVLNSLSNPSNSKVYPKPTFFYHTGNVLFHCENCLFLIDVNCKHKRLSSIKITFFKFVSGFPRPLFTTLFTHDWALLPTGFRFVLSSFARFTRTDSSRGWRTTRRRAARSQSSWGRTATGSFSQFTIWELNRFENKIYSLKLLTALLGIFILSSVSLLLYLSVSLSIPLSLCISVNPSIIPKPNLTVNLTACWPARPSLSPTLFPDKKFPVALLDIDFYTLERR